MTRLAGTQLEPTTTPEHLLRERAIIELLDGNMIYNQGLRDLLLAAQEQAHSLRSTHISLIRLQALVDGLRKLP